MHKTPDAKTAILELTKYKGRHNGSFNSTGDFASGKGTVLGNEGNSSYSMPESVPSGERLNSDAVENSLLKHQLEITQFVDNKMKDVQADIKSARIWNNAIGGIILTVVVSVTIVLLISYNDKFSGIIERLAKIEGILDSKK